MIHRQTIPAKRLFTDAEPIHIPARKTPAELRADAISTIARREAEAYRRRADVAEASGLQFEIGLLTSDIGKLCAELAEYMPKRDPALRYADVTLTELDCHVIVGYDYSPAERQTRDDPGCVAEVDICECWLNGADIAPVMTEGNVEQLIDAVFTHIEQQRESDLADRAEQYQIDRDARAYG